METVNQRRLLYVKDLRQMFPGLGSDTLYGLLKRGDIPSRIVGGKWVTTPDAVDGWVQGINSRGADPPPPKVVN